MSLLKIVSVDFSGELLIYLTLTILMKLFNDFHFQCFLKTNKNQTQQPIFFTFGHFCT